MRTGPPGANQDPAGRPTRAQRRERRERRGRRWLVALAATVVSVLVGGEVVAARWAAIPEPDEPGDWRQVFVEEFGTDAELGEFPGRRYSTRWGAYPSGWRDTTGRGTYRPDRVVSVRDGVLDYHLHVEDGEARAAALVPQLPTYGQLYGRYAVRFRADPVPGFKLTFLLWPDSEEWPEGGEVNFPEGDLDGTFSAFMHHADPAGTQDQFPTGQDFSRWRTAVIEWRPGEVRFLLDGQQVGVSTTKVPDESMHWVLQTETSTTPGEEPAPGASGHVQVDWVAAWSYRGPGAG